MAVKKTDEFDQMYQVAPGFDVTCVIGSVRFGDSDTTPYEAAFSLIGRHPTEGRFQFPHENGGVVNVIVEYEGVDK